MPLFEIAIVQQPTKKEAEEGTGTEKLLFGPKAVLARDAYAACRGIGMDLAESDWKKVMAPYRALDEVAAQAFWNAVKGSPDAKEV